MSVLKQQWIQQLHAHTRLPVWQVTSLEQWGRRREGGGGRGSFSRGRRGWALAARQLGEGNIKQQGINKRLRLWNVLWKRFCTRSAEGNGPEKVSKIKSWHACRIEWESRMCEERVRAWPRLVADAPRGWKESQARGDGDSARRESWARVSQALIGNLVDCQLQTGRGSSAVESVCTHIRSLASS